MGKKREIYVIRKGTTLVQKLPKGWGIRFDGDTIIAIHLMHRPKAIHVTEASHVPFHQWPEFGFSNG